MVLGNDDEYRFGILTIKTLCWPKLIAVNCQQ